MNPPRVAFFTDSYHEVNGVALTSREFAGFACRRDLPFLSVHPGPETRHWTEGQFQTLEMGNSGLVVQLEVDLLFDLQFLRHRALVREQLRQFSPDLVHVTGPGHTGILGALVAHDLKVPLVASWHTNLHEYGGRRLRKLLGALPLPWQDSAAVWAEDESLSIVLRFYNLAKLVFAPNQELVDLLSAETHRPAYLMQRGIDTQQFNPAHRTRHDDGFVIGFAGRLSPEKNVRQLEALERALQAAGAKDIRFVIVGDGNERDWLKANMRHAEFPGVLRGEALAKAYADMDVFAFPSETDTFGNVVVEAHASGVPVIVTNSGGPKFLVESGVDGFVAKDSAEFADAVLRLYRDRALLESARERARKSAMKRSWDAVFEGVYAHYPEIFETTDSSA